jgi:uncharacterized membrane protein YfcA
MLALMVTGAFLTSVISGVVGMAGGAMLLGLLVLTGMAPAVAVPVHAAVQLAANLTRTWAHLPYVRWRPFLVHALAAIPAPLLGLWLLARLDVPTVEALMGGAMLVAAWVPRLSFARLPESVAFGMAGVVSGSLGVVVGAVGPLLAPFFLRDGFDKRQLIATKAVCSGYNHVLKLVAFSGLYPIAVAGQSGGFDYAEHAPLLVPMALATVGGTYAGAWVLDKLSERTFVVLYRAVLTVMAAQLIGAAVL